METDVLNNKLESFAKCVNRIESKMPQNLARAVGFRNIAVHQYQSPDWEDVYAIITKNLADFRSFAGYVSNLTFGNVMQK